MIKVSVPCLLFGLLMLLQGLASAEPAPAPDMQTTQGLFLGIEQGDYAHWKIRRQSGKEASFFILQPDDSVRQALAKPQDYTGKNCRVHWKKTTEDIPEAGGKQAVKQIVSVEWLPAK